MSKQKMISREKYDKDLSKLQDIINYQFNQLSINKQAIMNLNEAGRIIARDKDYEIIKLKLRLDAALYAMILMQDVIAKVNTGEQKANTIGQIIKNTNYRFDNASKSWVGLAE